MSGAFFSFAVGARRDGEKGGLRPLNLGLKEVAIGS